MHAIWTLPKADANFGLRWGKIKRLVSQQCGTYYALPNLQSKSNLKRHESTIWQRRFWEHQIRDDIDYATHMDYIHINPVKHGMVKQAIDWQYSTFHQYNARGVYAPDWGVADILGDFGE